VERIRALVRSLVRAGQVIAEKNATGSEAHAAIAFVERLVAASVSGARDKALRTELHRAVDLAARMIRNDERPPNEAPGPHPALYTLYELWPETAYRMSESAFEEAAEAAARASSGKRDSRWPQMAKLFESAGLGIIEPGAIEREYKRLRKSGQLA
jgi:hypothetical protein